MDRHGPVSLALMHDFYHTLRPSVSHQSKLLTLVVALKSVNIWVETLSVMRSCNNATGSNLIQLNIS